MPNIADLKSQLGQIESIKEITQAMADIATSQIKQRRANVERNIRYFREIFVLYETVKRIALKTKRYKDTQIQKNGKTAMVLLTANNKFNGNLDVELTNFFVQQAANRSADMFVAGSSGQEVLSSRRLKGRFEPIKLTRDFPPLEEIVGLVDKVKMYTQVLVFHSRFVTLLNQEPAMTDITATEELAGKTEVENINFILEPEIDKMIAFFEDQMMLLLIQAIFLESEIARTAARMISMNQAEQAAEKILIDQQKALFQGRRSLANMKIVENFASAYAGKA